jgi:hypothetical protein
MTDDKPTGTPAVCKHRFITSPVCLDCGASKPTGTLTDEEIQDAYVTTANTDDVAPAHNEDLHMMRYARRIESIVQKRERERAAKVVRDEECMHAPQKYEDCTGCCLADAILRRNDTTNGASTDNDKN